MFCVTTADKVPACSSSASFRCARFGWASSASMRSLSKAKNSAGCASKKLREIICSGGWGYFCAYSPSGLRKSGMPLSVDTPAPPKNTMRPGFVSSTQFRNASIPRRASSSMVPPR